jgi:hypothetical protein
MILLAVPLTSKHTPTARMPDQLPFYKLQALPIQQTRRLWSGALRASPSLSGRVGGSKGRRNFG